MLTRVRIEVFNPDADDAGRELDELELALLRQELEATGAIREGESLARAATPEADMPLAELDERGEVSTPEQWRGRDSLHDAVVLFRRLGEGAIERKLTEQMIRHSESGGGWVARRVVRYDNGAFEQED